MDDFSELKVSTTTATSTFNRPINIIDIAKYLPLDDVVIGVKLVYAGGLSSIIRGVARLSKKKKDFYNQVTFTVRLPVKNDSKNSHNSKSSMITSCKVFHNGSLHVTGTLDLEQSVKVSNLLLTRLDSFCGEKVIQCVPNTRFLYSYDNVLYSSKGEIIGWCNGTDIYLKNEYVTFDKLNSDDTGKETSFPVFVSNKWIDGQKRIYSIDGECIGKRVLEFNSSVSKRNFEVKFGYIYSKRGNKILGKEEIFMNEGYIDKLEQCMKRIDFLLEKKVILHVFDAYSTLGRSELSELFPFKKEDFRVHMINTYFKAPFTLNRTKLHKEFLNKGYYSRYDPCANAAVNLRFHYNLDTLGDKNLLGKCPNREKVCSCKDISISCFNSGKVNVTGLLTIEQGYVVYEFMKSFLDSFNSEEQGIQIR